MKSFVFTLGFHEDFIERRLHNSRASRDDVIRVFSCSPIASGVRRAYEALRARSYSIGVSEPVLIELPCHDIAEGIYVSRKVIRELPEPIIADLSGGMRLAVLIVYTSLLLERKYFTLYLQPEGGGEEVMVPYEILKLIWTNLPPEEEKLLKTIVSLKETDTKELSRILGKKEKTIANQLTKLRKHKLITKKGRKPTIQPTKWAKAITPP